VETDCVGRKKLKTKQKYYRHSPGDEETLLPLNKVICYKKGTSGE
jgi:hypothetical protein